MEQASLHDARVPDQLVVLEHERVHPAEGVVECVIREVVEGGVHQGTDGCLHVIVKVSRMGSS